MGKLRKQNVVRECGTCWTFTLICGKKANFSRQNKVSARVPAPAESSSTVNNHGLISAICDVVEEVVV